MDAQLEMQKLLTGASINPVAQMQGLQGIQSPLGDNIGGAGGQGQQQMQGQQMTPEQAQQMQAQMIQQQLQAQRQQAENLLKTHMPAQQPMRLDFEEQLQILRDAIPTKKLSLKSLSTKQKKKIRDSFKKGRDKAKSFYNETIQPSVIKRQEVYDTPIEFYKKKFPNLSELTNWISRDVKTTIDTMIPSLVEVFTGTDDPCDIKGCNINDDMAARSLQEILRYQINRKNQFFPFIYNFIREGLITNEGVAKVYWERLEDRTEMQVMASIDNIGEFIMLAQKGKIEIKKIEEVTGIGAIVTYDDIKVTKNCPVLENMSPSELRYTPDGRTVQECKFVAHRKIVKGDYLKRKEKEGVYSNVDEAIKLASSQDADYTELDIRNNPGLENLKNTLSDDDDASKDIELYEAYLNVDYNNDGIMEKLIVHAVGDVLLSVQENTYCNPPFFIFSPEGDPYTPFGKASFADTLEQLQDLKTALVRQLIIAVGKNNMPQRFVNANKIDIDGLINNDEIIPTSEDPNNSIFIPPQIPISPITMDLVNYAQSEIEAQSGSTRYNQGLDSNSLNKTATGVTAIMGAADKRIRLLARIFAESAWVPIIKHIILLNQKFLDDEQQVRLNDRMIDISRETLNIDYDLIVNTGQGAGTKEAQMNYLIMIMQSLYPALQQMGIANETTYYKTACDLLELMGIRGQQSYMLDPESEEFKRQQQEKQQAQQQAQQQAVQQEQNFKREEWQLKYKPKLSAQYADLPPDAKVEMLEKYLGLQTNQGQVLLKEKLDAEKWGN